MSDFYMVNVDFLGTFGPDHHDFEVVLVSDDGEGRGRGAINVNNRAAKCRVRAAATDAGDGVFEVLGVAENKSDHELFMVSILFNGGSKGLTLESARKNYRDQWDGMDFDYLLSTIEEVDAATAERALHSMSFKLYCN